MSRIYTAHIRFHWSEAKRRSNFRVHGLDFADAAAVFEGVTVTVEDRRYGYRERRWFTLGLLGQRVVSIAHTEDDNDIRLISFREATRREAKAYFDAIQAPH